MSLPTNRMPGDLIQAVDINQIAEVVNELSDSGPYKSPVLLRTNLAHKPVPFTTGGWSAGGRFTSSLDTTVVRRSGTSSAKLVRNASSLDAYLAQWDHVGSAVGMDAQGVQVAAGQPVNYSVWVRSSVLGRARMVVNHYNSSAAVLTSVSGEYSDLLANTWQQITFTATPPDGTVTVRIIAFIALPTGQTAVGGEESWAQDALVEQGSTGDYFDGSFEATSEVSYEWQGEPFASPSQQWTLAKGLPPLIEWTLADAYDVTAVTATDISTGLATTATVSWPDASPGVFTGTVNTEFGAYDAYTITHANSGQQVTQATVARGPDGAVTSKPALTVGAF